ncbi:hypothetical protein CY34DRAFT_11207 [Suillus luteus UH-Slu-Lm8-n1]|uniref:Uncharacterized protein n=1 Tax=Suillus luteus UH-Slu-Lm8-n1 TaxID=930992 RepID=A0A0D0A2P7_9AGAM|nr:hypothetical protein CY34DRAFT_11207 [Suillus luteus UH-Slu-Lm8-n1]
MNVQQENLDLVKERDHYRAKCATANTQLASMENTIEDLKTQLNDSKRYVLQLQNGNERQHETRATTTNFSAATLGRDIEVLITNLNDSKRHVTQLQDENERLVSLNATMKHDAESLRTQLIESKWNVVQLQKDNEQLQNQASAILALERETDKLNKQLNESKQHAAQLQNDNKQLQKEASEVPATKRQPNDAKAQWDNESETRATATAALKHEVKGLTRKARPHDSERRVAGLFDGVFHNHRLRQESRIVREATPVTPASVQIVSPLSA